METVMTKENFLLLLERQRGSGVSVRDFCKREGYSLGSYYYWKGKFCAGSSPAGSGGAARSRRAIGCGEDNNAGILAPVSFPMPEEVRHNSQTEGDANPPSGECARREAQEAQDLNEIVIELPAGVRIRFRGSLQLQAATRLITQMVTSIHPGHVLPQ